MPLFGASRALVGWTPSALCRHHSARADDSYGMGSQRPQRKESKMNATTAAIDLAKNVFQVALADGNHRVLEQHRLTRAQFERFFDNRKIARVVMEACGSAHHWARVFAARGIEVVLLPAHNVRAYVRRSKTDAADALALLEAARCGEIVSVKVKSVEQQSLQALHRTRSLWMGRALRASTRCAAFVESWGCTCQWARAPGWRQWHGRWPTINASSRPCGAHSCSSCWTRSACWRHAWRSSSASSRWLPVNRRLASCC